MGLTFEAKKLRFYKENQSWYADVKEHPKADNLMINGADVFLESVSNGKPEVTLTFSRKPINDYQYHLSVKSHNQWGATYSVEGKDLSAPVDTLWLCNVMHTVMMEHPKNIYVSI